RSGLIEASAALAGCDIALCALLGRGKVDEAEELGKKVIPLAKRLARLRIELRQGRGAGIVAYCDALGKRSAQVLTEIRARITSIDGKAHKTFG
ncbi:MAG: hypothetical protein QG656_2651, partial [Candidatus Hydrogenedentes bacterium]|nr:hypothetical protein [Candidatus Hydrogenedentota bacterium]